MNIATLFGALARAFAHPTVDPSVAVAKLAQVQSGLATAEAVVQSLPEGTVKTDALAALHEAAALAGKAIAIAHTVAAVEAVAAVTAVKAAGDAKKSAG